MNDEQHLQSLKTTADNLQRTADNLERTADNLERTATALHRSVEKLSVGWRQMFDNRWEWWYHLTETPEEMYFEFWMMLNMDMVAYEEEMYYNGKKK